jgi:hypothetical protein
MEMKRNKAVEGKPVIQKIEWVNRGGSFDYRDEDNKVHKIKPNQKFMAPVILIPEAFRDVIRPVSALPAEQEIGVVDIGFRMKQRGSTKLFDIVNASNKVMNEKGLTKSQATKLLSELLMDESEPKEEPEDEEEEIG